MNPWSRFKHTDGARGKERQYRIEQDGYSVLHPTKGWRSFTDARATRISLTEAKRTGMIPWWAGVKALEEKAHG